MFKAIIFDCFGVLAGSSYKRIYQKSGGDLNKDADYVESQLHAANTGQISNVELNNRVAKRIGKTPDEWHQIVVAEEQPNRELLDYIKNTLKPKYKVAVLSNAYKGTLERKFSKDQLAIFDAKIVSAEVGMIKPQPEIYQYAAKQLNTGVDECVFIDDLLPYVEAAKQVGMQAMQYKNFSQFKRELTDILAQKYSE